MYILSIGETIVFHVLLILKLEAQPRALKFIIKIWKTSVWPIQNVITYPRKIKETIISQIMNVQYLYREKYIHLKSPNK